MSETIPLDEVSTKKKVGKLKEKSVYHIKLRGGLHLMATEDGKIVSTGPHRAVAKCIANQYEPDIEWTELSKSDHVQEESYAHLIPKYRELSDKIRSMQVEVKQE